MINFLPFHGSVVLLGRPGQYQSPLAFDLAMHVALGNPVVILDDQGHLLSDRMTAWRLARGCASRLHAAGLKFADVACDVKALAARIQKTMGGSPKLILRDLSLNMVPLDASDPWLRDAETLARTFDCAVLTVGHIGVQPLADATVFAADEIWSCSTFHDKVRESDVNVRLQRLKPASSDTIELHGSEGRAITFDRAAELEETAHG
jgi:hypothetical protein